MPNVTKILRWFQPNNFLWKRNSILIQNTYIRIIGVALLCESIARIIEKPLLILSFRFLRKKNPPVDFFKIVNLTSITVLNDTEKYSNVFIDTFTAVICSYKVFFGKW